MGERRSGRRLNSLVVRVSIDPQLKKINMKYVSFVFIMIYKTFS